MPRNKYADDVTVGIWIACPACGGDQYKRVRVKQVTTTVRVRYLLCRTCGHRWKRMEAKYTVKQV